MGRIRQGVLDVRRDLEFEIGPACQVQQTSDGVVVHRPKPRPHLGQMQDFFVDGDSSEFSVPTCPRRANGLEGEARRERLKFGDGGEDTVLFQGEIHGYVVIDGAVVG